MAKGRLKQGQYLPQSSDTTTETPTLSDMGISKKQSSRPYPRIARELLKLESVWKQPASKPPAGN